MFCLWIEVFPKNPLVADVSVLVAFKQLYNINSNALLLFSELSVKVASGILIFTCPSSTSNPVAIIVYSTPTKCCEVTPFSIQSSYISFCPVISRVLPEAVSFVVTFEPFIINCNVSFVNVLFEKYLSVPLIIIVASCLSRSTVCDSTDQIGFTISRVSFIPVPSGKFIPNVIVCAIFVLFSWSFTLPFATPICTLPLYSKYWSPSLICACSKFEIVIV